MKIKEITQYLESIAPLSLQESYDNAGLIIGSPDMEITKALITLDITYEVMNEAIAEGCNLIIAHHPLIFKEIKKLNGGNLVEDLVIKAIQNNIAIYAIHTNLDNVNNGVNAKFAEKLELKNIKILSPFLNQLNKLVIFCPTSHAKQVRNAIFEAGGGQIGNYSHCSFNTNGEGSFKANENTNPFVGKIGELHYEKEIKIETIVPKSSLSSVLKAMRLVHPYEEIAYDIYPLENKWDQTGAGMIGELENEMPILDFLKSVKNNLLASRIRHSVLIDKPVKKVAICGGSGSFLMQKAYKQGAQVFVTSDIKYHDFFNYENQMTLVDAGHYETEQFTKLLLFDLLTKKFPTFALQISKINTNPISFL
ncbi:MAG: Nif3-like dinuclear metal center hexameric protein [Bacteroidales bacterium]|nr:Nif3-like dinuclear metal center hexameric protein [Bacteroidales bacterium]